MNFFDTLRDLFVRHLFGARSLDSRGDHDLGQRPGGAPTLMANQKTAQPVGMPRVNPVVYGLVAYIELQCSAMYPSAAVEQQQRQSAGTEVLMRMLARQVLQGLLLRLTQLSLA
jgi:hypothetical protein